MKVKETIHKSQRLLINYWESICLKLSILPILIIVWLSIIFIIFLIFYLHHLAQLIATFKTFHLVILNRILRARRTGELLKSQISRSYQNLRIFNSNSSSLLKNHLYTIKNWGSHKAQEIYFLKKDAKEWLCNGQF